MGKIPTIVYATTIASLGIVILYQLFRPPRIDGDSPSPTRGNAAVRLSAIKQAPATAVGKVAKELDAVRLRNRRLHIQLDSLEATTDRTGFVEVDREAFCKSNALNLRSVTDVDPTSGSLADALALSDPEIGHLQAIFSDFHTRLKAIEQEVVEIIQAPDDRPTQLEVRIPAHVAGKDAAFLQLGSELHDLLGPGRGGVAMAALRENDLIGTPNSIKSYSFTKSPDGNIEFTTARVEVTRLFPGTDKPYDGTPGVEPDVFSQRKLITSVTMPASEVEMLFNGLVDLSMLESR